MLTLPACVPGAPAGRHTILPWTKKKHLESTSRRNTEQKLSSLPPSVPEQQLFGLAGLEIGGRADFKRPICGWGVSNFRTEQIMNEEELD